MATIDPIEGQHYHIREYGDKISLESTLFHGLVKGCAKLGELGYTIHYDGCRVQGNLYIIPAEKPKEGATTASIEVEELKKKVDEYMKQERSNKSLIARYKNKIDKLEKELEGLKSKKTTK